MSGETNTSPRDDQQTAPDAEPSSWLHELPAGMGVQSDGTFVLPLREPIRLGRGEPVETLTFRRPKGRDMQHLQMPSKEKPQTLEPQLRFAASLTGRPLVEILEAGAEDTLRILEVVGFLLDPAASRRKTAK